MSVACATEKSPQLNLRVPYDTVFSYVFRGIAVINNREDVNYDHLLNRVKNERCETSFRLLFDHFYSKVLSYFRRGGVTEQKCSDLAQETLLTVWHKSSYFDSSKGSCGSWIFTIARNLRYDYFRSLNRDVLSIGADDLYDFLDNSSLQIDNTKDLSEDVRERINSLPPEQKDAVYAMYFEGYSHGEYAELKKIPLGTVKSRIRLALAHLKKGLEDL